MFKICLSSLRPGESARVVEIDRGCRGNERRRLLDLGVVPGTIIRVAFRSPAGDPVAYEVRGTTLALRREQANYIHVVKAPATGGTNGSNQ